METYEAYQLQNHIRTWSNDRIKADGSVDTSFPYPDKYTRTTAVGELADRIRFALSNGKPETLETYPVFLTETTQYGGYSEYTQDNFTFLKIECDDISKTIKPTISGSAFSLMLEWLDEAEEAHNLTPAQIRELLDFAKENGWTGFTSEEEEDSYRW